MNQIHYGESFSFLCRVWEKFHEHMKAVAQVLIRSLDSERGVWLSKERERQTDIYYQQAKP